MSIFHRQAADPKSLYDALVAAAFAARVMSRKRGQEFNGRDVEGYAAKHLATLDMKPSASQRKQLAACGMVMEVSQSTFAPILDKLVASAMSTGVYNIRHDIKEELARELKSFGMLIHCSSDMIELNDRQQPMDELVSEIKADILRQAGLAHNTMKAATQSSAVPPPQKITRIESPVVEAIKSAEFVYPSAADVAARLEEFKRKREAKAEAAKATREKEVRFGNSVRHCPNCGSSLVATKTDPEGVGVRCCACGQRVIL